MDIDENNKQEIAHKKNSFNATGDLSDLMIWIGRYGIWLWLGSFAMFCFTLAYYLGNFR